MGVWDCGGGPDVGWTLVGRQLVVTGEGMKGEKVKQWEGEGLNLGWSVGLGY
ncbi:hypothetical protein QJS04_geneDACA004389 [Acorus gramineus]|uniref:Uncharacterized protein n=1 Tax=Acorus gramineus TaxID=55184 RepID=A0AAV9B2V4_ACOGR|nr:hypothetical protein QJS04_geneDACA004389 [Acorus gramineus]